MPGRATTLRCASWNVNGLRALARKGLLPWEQLADYDVLCLQETKANPDQLPPELAEPDGWHAHWASAVKSGYSGVALLSREAPDEVRVGIGHQAIDDEGRVVAARFGEVVVISAYFPNSQDGGKRLPFKLEFCASMERYLAEWRQRGCETLLMGDYNIAPQAIDLARPAANETSPGYLPEERAWFARYLDLGYRDVFRERNPDKAGAYSWWSFRTRARERNIGWRIDFGTTSGALSLRVQDTCIHPHVDGSDHCPVSVVLS